MRIYKYINSKIKIKVMCTSGNLYECQEEWENHWAEQELEKKKKTICSYSGLPNMQCYE